MNNYNLNNHLSKSIRKLNHRLAGEGILNGEKSMQSPASFREIEKDLCLISIKNELRHKMEFGMEFPKEAIVFVFSREGGFYINSEYQNAAAEITAGRNYGLMAFPFKNWKIDVAIKKQSVISFLCIGLKKVHELFALDIDQKLDPAEISKNYRSKSFLNIKKSEPEDEIFLRQLFNHRIKEEYAGIYEKAKIVEFLVHYMDDSRRENTKSTCPVINDNLEEVKIKRAEKILISNMLNPPSIPELARMVGTNEMKLKNSFRSIYGNSIYAYLQDYRMNKARLIMDSGNVQVKDVAFRIGYSNPSHFIAAFKKKFGITPKKYLNRA